MCSIRYFVGYSMWYSIRYSRYSIDILGMLESI